MGFFASIKTCFAKFAVFRGRASRSEFWWFTLFSFVIVPTLCFSVIPAVIFAAAKLTSFASDPSATQLLIISVLVFLIVCFVIFIPGLAVTIRRLHDIGVSGWRYLFFLFLPDVLLCVIELVGKTYLADLILSPYFQIYQITTFILTLYLIVAGIWFLVLFCKKGSDEPNKYGESPLKPGVADSKTASDEQVIKEAFKAM